MDLLLTTAGMTPARWLGCLLIAALAGYVAIDHARHLRHARGRAAWVWLGASGLALGTGLWSSQLVQLGALQPQFTMNGSGTIAAWLAGSVASLLALGLIHWRRPTPRRMAAGAGALAATVLGAQWLLLASVQSAAVPNLAGRFLISLVIALGGSALVVFACRRRRATRRHRGRLWQIAAALLFGLMVIATQHVSTTPLNGLAPLAGKGIGAAALALLASVGSVVLLLVMWASSTLEAQLKASLRRTRAELARQAQCDPLTGLPNRGMLEARLAQAVRRADATRGRFALLVIDLDGFKPINEVFGHRHGDRVLQEMAARLRVMLRPDDFIARMGGDEFLLLLGNDPRPEDVRTTAEAVLAALAQPIAIDGRESSMPASIGSATYPLHGDAVTLITHADAAMRAAKSSGGATHCVFEPRMVAGAREQADLLRDLREALSRRQFELYYQPKIHGPSGQITGVEALLRWHHPERGMVSPGIFIPLAERFGLIDALGEWVIDEACRQSGEWRDRGMRMRIAVNLSAHQLRNVRLADHIAAALARHQVNPKLLTCEITESVAMDDGEATMSVFKRLAATGIHISIDDFGTGYSSLAYLRKLPAEELKIDRSFVLDLEGSADARAVVDAVIKLAQALGLKVVAEGVETAEQSRILRLLGCDELQGFLYARPMPAKALSLWAIDDAVPTQPLELEFRESLFADTLPAGLG